MHPSEELRGSKGSDLSGKKIIVGVTGSIAAVECVKLVRELVREGAEVHCVMTEWGSKIIHPNSLQFASGNEVITELTGKVEHVSHCGNVPDKADLFLIAPATANTVSKIAKGID
ncbi:MAG: flavoprotein, partial [Candidatus Aenigmatarchaeota archaeon]